MMMLSPALVLVVSLLGSVEAQELITLDSACGVLLQSSCPDLQKYVVGKITLTNICRLYVILHTTTTLTACLKINL